MLERGPKVFKIRRNNGQEDTVSVDRLKPAFLEETILSSDPQVPGRYSPSRAGRLSVPPTRFQTNEVAHLGQLNVNLTLLTRDIVAFSLLMSRMLCLPIFPSQTRLMPKCLKDHHYIFQQRFNITYVSFRFNPVISLTDLRIYY